MKNITLSVDDQTYRSARAYAAWHDTSLSNLVKQFLHSVGGQQAKSGRVRPLPDSKCQGCPRSVPPSPPPLPPIFR